MPLLIGRNPEPKRRSRPRVLGAFIGAKGRALTDAGAEGSSPLSRMLTHPLPSDVILYFPDLIEQLIELLFGHRACGRKKRSHRIHQEQPSSDDLTQLDAGFDAFFVPANLAQISSRINSDGVCFRFSTRVMNSFNFVSFSLVPT